jgi:hypothetical protein
MKKILWTGSLLLLCTAVMADDGDKTTIDGMKIQKITFDGDKMTVKYNDGTADATFDMAEVSSASRVPQASRSASPSPDRRDWKARRYTR